MKKKRKTLTNEEMDRLIMMIDYEPPKDMGACIKTISHNELGKLEVKVHCEPVLEKGALVI
jgi:hypothetical protein